MKKNVEKYLRMYHEIMSGDSVLCEGKIPGGYFIDRDIMMLPTDTGDTRYPYGADGFNYWTYGSGYIHCNEGLFSPFLRASEGAEPKIAFFAGIQGENHKFSCLSVPIMQQEPQELVRFTVFSKDKTYYITDTDKLTTALITYVKGRKIYYKLILMNKTGQPLTVFSSAYFNPFLKNALVENSTDRWFRQVRYHEDQQLGYFNIETYEERDRDSMATNYGVIYTDVDKPEKVLSASHTTSRYQYVGGARSSLHTAKVFQEEALADNVHATSFTETGICGDFITYRLEDTIEYHVEMRYARTDEEFAALTHTQVQEKPSEVKEQFLAQVDGGRDINSAIMNGFLHHLKEQVTFCSEIKGYIQLSHFSLIGIRDIFQALEGYLYYEPEKAKNKMLEALDFTSLTGQLPRQYSLPEHENSLPAMDLRPFIDQGVWVISTIMTYLRFTNDWSLLNEQCGYYDFVDVHKHIAKKNDVKESVLMHLVRIMEYLLENRDHEHTKCVLALYGDWNDALDGLGRSQDPNKEYGTGVSVMATLQVYQNLCEMLEIMGYLKDKPEYSHLYEILNERKEGYQKAKEEIIEGLLAHAIDGDHIIHGWGDQKSYLVGSRNDPDGVARDGLTSQAFWILSEFMKIDANYPKHREYILKAYERLDSKYGYKTFEPYFEKGVKGVGRIPNLPKGTAENGATYIHASMFGAMSLFAIGEGKQAWDQLEKLLPFTHDTVSVSPFVVPNSYGDNEEFHIDGESMQDWQTGSSNVLFKLLVRFVYGFEPTLGGLKIQPSRYQYFDKLSLKINYLGKKIHLKYSGKAKEEATNREFKMNGEVHKGNVDPYMQMETLFIPDEWIQRSNDEILIEVIDR